MRYMFLILCIIINNCNNSKLKDFSNERLQIDSTLGYNNLKMINSVNLEENDTIIIKNINNCDFNYEKDLMLVSDLVSRKIILFKHSNGQLINSFTITSKVNDSVVLTGKTVYPATGLTWKYILSQDYKLFNIDIDKEFMKPTIGWVNFMDANTIAAVGTTYVPIYSSLGDINMANETVFIYLDDSLNILNVSIPEDHNNNQPAGQQFESVPGIGFLALSCFGNYDEFITNRFDSIETISLYNKDGQYLSAVANLPYTYTHNYLGTNVVYMPYFDFLGDTIFIGYPYCDTIFTSNNKPLFKIKNLPFNNVKGIAYYRNKLEPYYKNFKTTILPTDSGYSWRQKYMAMYREKEKNYSFSAESFHELMPISISGIFRIKDNIMIWLMIKDKDAEMGYYYFLQEYKSDGTLVKYLKIEDNTKEKLQYVTFDNSSDKLVMIKKTKKNIVMENYKWE